MRKKSNRKFRRFRKEYLWAPAFDREQEHERFLPLFEAYEEEANPIKTTQFDVILLTTRVTKNTKGTGNVAAGLDISRVRVGLYQLLNKKYPYLRERRRQMFGGY